MAIIQGLLVLVSRQAGKLINIVFGWAMIVLFGRVQKDRELALSGICFASIAWIIVVLGVISPSVGTFLLAFAPVPDWVDESYVRLAMLAAAVLLPGVIGLVSLRLTGGSGKGAWVKALLRGYPTTIALALTFIMLMVFAPLMQLRYIARRWTTVHVPMLVEPAEYPSVVDQLQHAIAANGVETRREQASWMIRFPTRLLTLLAARSVSGLVADRLTELKANELEVTLHPADLVIRGKEETTSRVRAVFAETLIFSDANLTWTKEANQIEDRIRVLCRSLADRRERFSRVTAVQALKAINADVRAADLPYEEWEVLNRAIGQVDRTILAMAVGGMKSPAELIEGEERIAAARILPRPPLANGRTLPRSARVLALLFLAWLGRHTPEGREILSVGTVANMARVAARSASARAMDPVHKPA